MTRVIVDATVALRCHPSTAAPAVRGIRARVRRLAIGVIDFLFCVEGDVGRLRVPAAAPPRRADFLWRHTCLEAFIAPEGEPGYEELNFSPSGEWAAYAFRSYRERTADPDRSSPLVVVRSGDGHLELEASVALAQTVSLRIGLAAVIEADDGALSYWALEHPGATPDFHDARAFALRLEAPRADVLGSSG